MKKLLFQFGVAVYNDIKEGEYRIFTIIGAVVISFIFIASVSINMIASFWDQDDYINDEFDVGKTEVYGVINDAYEQFMLDMRKKMDEREAEIIAENTERIEEKTIDENGNEVINIKEVCHVTVNKECNGFSFAYVLAYINYTSNVRITMSKSTMTSAELYDFMKEICVMDEIQNGNSYLLFTKVLSPKKVAEKYYTDKDTQDKYILSYTLYDDFLGFAQNSLVVENDAGASQGGSSSYISMEDLQKYISNLPPDADIAQAVINFAANNLGAIYSQAKRTQQGYFDCSSFAFSAYVAAGVFEAGTPPTAADLCRIVEQKGSVSSVDNLQPGDLIFYNFGKRNGRYKDIEHVAIYVGDGMVMDASSSKGYTVHRQIYSKNNIVSAGRPYR